MYVTKGRNQARVGIKSDVCSAVGKSYLNDSGFKAPGSLMNISLVVDGVDLVRSGR